MPQTLEKLRLDLGQLPANQRAELARFLIESLDIVSDEDAGAAWDVELARRIAMVKSGKAITEPAEDVFARLREKYG